MKLLFFSLIVFLGLHSFAQNDAVINDANAQKRTLNAAFTAISVSDGVDLFLTQGNEESIAVSASDTKYLERYKTLVENGVLKIYYDNKGIAWIGSDKRKLKAYVSFKILETLNASGGAEVVLKSVLNLDNIECSFTSGSTFNGEVNIRNLTISQNSGSEIEINGKADNLKIEVSSGAILKGYDLIVDYCDAKATSGGSVRINVNKELNAKANSGGGIRYKGNGVIKDVNVNSGGVVKKG